MRFADFFSPPLDPLAEIGVRVSVLIQTVGGPPEWRSVTINVRGSDDDAFVQHFVTAAVEAGIAAWAVQGSPVGEVQEFEIAALIQGGIDGATLSTF